MPWPGNSPRFDTLRGAGGRHSRFMRNHIVLDAFRGQVVLKCGAMDMTASRAVACLASVQAPCGPHRLRGGLLSYNKIN